MRTAEHQPHLSVNVAKKSMEIIMSDTIQMMILAYFVIGATEFCLSVVHIQGAIDRDGQNVLGLKTVDSVIIRYVVNTAVN
jgi:hypothetical protein